MAEVGADAVLVITPSYYKNGMTDEALFQHFNKVREILHCVTTLHFNFIFRQSFVVENVKLIIVNIFNDQATCCGEYWLDKGVSIGCTRGVSIG